MPSTFPTFETVRTVPFVVPNLAQVGEEVMQYYRVREFTVSGGPTPTGGYFISLHQGGGFKAILGLKTALNIELEPVNGSTLIRAGVGIFDTQLIPTIITVFVFLPVILTQLWGVIQQQALDEEAVEYAVSRLNHYRPHSGSPTTPEETYTPEI